MTLKAQQEEEINLEIDKIYSVTMPQIEMIA